MWRVVIHTAERGPVPVPAVGDEPVGWVALVEGVGVGVGGGVLVGGAGAEVGVEEGYAGGDVVFFVAGLVEVVPGGEDEGGGEQERRDQPKALNLELKA